MRAVRAIHSALIAEYGGLDGIRDENLLESALVRPLIRSACGEPDLCVLAAAYGFGLCRDHPFLDGNKRIALVIVDVFLQRNGHELVASEEDAVATFRELAAGDLGEAGLTDWIRENSAPLRDGD